MSGKPFWRSSLFWPYLIAAVITTAIAVYGLVAKGEMPGLYEIALVSALWGGIVWRVITKEPLEPVRDTLRRFLGGDPPKGGGRLS